MRFEILSKSNEMQVLRISLDAGETIPLHDHPQTRVFMYVTKGLMKVDFYRYQGDKTQGRVELASAKQMGVGTHDLITEQDVNLHYIEAVEATEFLDVMAPAYFEDETLAPNWFDLSEDEAGLKLTLVPPPADVVAAKERALAEFKP